ncbi:MAG: hypothetical protein F4073_08405 [Rhodobacteraceae bacterium]|nr:hypothetical protein [Paracoccaceae bacterium]MYF46325.1 hypothetical protein [Paracoccaceae bacterium]MYG09545.1 hypothetical protein [Paracoccaceae bacterium]MYI91960.1 hypothetical protein [Paracoccaceae bacterium]MYJ86662.1 hypothetical protein [Paracoccaceae bacterium]
MDPLHSNRFRKYQETSKKFNDPSRQSGDVPSGKTASIHPVSGVIVVMPGFPARAGIPGNVADGFLAIIGVDKIDAPRSVGNKGPTPYQTKPRVKLPVEFLGIRQQGWIFLMRNVIPIRNVAPFKGDVIKALAIFPQQWFEQLALGRELGPVRLFL